MLPKPGGLILMGTYAGPQQGIYLSKVDYNGNLIWNKTFPGNRLYAKGIESAENNGFMVAAVQEAAVYGDGYDAHLMKFDSLGNLLWNKSYGYSESFTPHVIKLLSDGNYMIAGRMMMKITKEGNIIWIKQANYGKNIKDICETADHGFVAVASDDWGVPDMTVLYKLDSSVNILREVVIGAQYDDAYVIHLTSDGGYIIGGSSGSIPPHNGFRLLKTDSLGMTGCNNVNDNPGYNFYYSLCIINAPSLTQTTLNVTGNLSLFSNPGSVSVLNACCYAEAKIVPDGYSYSFCHGDSLHYSGSGAPHLLWSTGDTTASIVTLDTVVYLTATNTCGSFRDTIETHPGHIPPLSYSINKDTICVGDSVILSIHDHNPYHGCYGGYYIERNDSTYVLKPVNTSTYHVSSYTSIYGPGCSNVQAFTIYVDAGKPSITKTADTLISSSPNNNQWFINGAAIPGATSQKLTIGLSGIYSVKVSGIFCQSVSDDFPCSRDTVIAGGGWQKIIAANNGGPASCTIQTDDGGFIIGSTYRVMGKEKITLVKTDRNTEVQWSKQYGGNGIDRLGSILKLNDGYLICGSTTSFGKGGMDVYLIRVDVSGQVLWGKTFGDWNDQTGSAVTQTSDGNFLIAGTSTNPYQFMVDPDGWSINQNDLYLIKVNSNGDLLWNKRIDAGAGETGFAISETSSKDIIIGANTNYKLLVIQTDSAGNLNWSKQIINSGSTGLPAIKTNSDNTTTICTSKNNGTWIIRIAANGNIIWSKALDAWEGNTFSFTSDSGIIVATKNSSFGSDVLTKLDQNGNVSWSKIFTNLFRTYITSAIELNDGSFLLSGGIDTSHFFSNGEIYLINANAQGETNCTSSNTTSISNEPYNIVSTTLQFSALGEEAVVNTIALNDVQFNTSSICTYIPFAINVPEIITDTKLNVYPNPSCGIINLEYNFPDKENILNVYDLFGRLIYSKKLEKSNTAQIDLGTRVSGIYLLELLNSEERIVKKIIINY